MTKKVRQINKVRPVLLTSKQHSTYIYISFSQGCRQGSDNHDANSWTDLDNWSCGTIPRCLSLHVYISQWIAGTCVILIQRSSLK